MRKNLGAEQLVRKVLLDKKSGSTTLALRALRALADSRPSVAEARAAAALMAEAGKQMAVLGNAARVFGRLMDGGAEPSAAARRVARLLRESVERCAGEGAKLLSGFQSVVTLSNSEQLCEMLRRARVDTIYVLESRPGGEGAVLAGRLRRLGKNVVLAADLSAHILVARCGCVVVGTDTLYVDGFTNKLGSGLVARLATLFSKPFYAATTKWKVAWGKGGGVAPDHSALFEHVDNALVSGYITETGLLGAWDAHATLAALLERLPA